MGIQVTYRRLPESELARLEADPQRAMTYLFSLSNIALAEIAAILDNPQGMETRAAELRTAFENAQSDPARVDLDKDWHALHFLLTDDPSLDPVHRPNEPLHNIVMGGHPTTIEVTYGPVRRFSIEDIRQIVDALSILNLDELRRRSSVDAFNAANIYPNPQPGRWDAEEIEGVFQVLPRLQQLFSDALAENEVVIVYSA